MCLGVLVLHSKCGPRLSAAAAEKLKNRYVLMRTGAREHEREMDKRPSIPITIRYAQMCIDAVFGNEYEVQRKLNTTWVSMHSCISCWNMNQFLLLIMQHEIIHLVFQWEKNRDLLFPNSDWWTLSCCGCTAPENRVLHLVSVCKSLIFLINPRQV